MPTSCQPQKNCSSTVICCFKHFIIHLSWHDILHFPEQTRITLTKTLTMFFFTFLHLLLFSWEECTSLPHSRIYSTDEFQIQPNESTTTNIPSTMQVSNHFFTFINDTHMQSRPHRQIHRVKSIRSRLISKISTRKMLSLNC